jgi:hypothetical protein
MHKDYLGDGCYAERDDNTNDIVLTTENGVEVTNRIVIEQAVWQALLQWILRTRE